LYAVKNLKTFPAFLLNICGLATSIFNFVLGLETAAAISSPAPPTISICIYTCIAINYS